MGIIGGEPGSRGTAGMEIDTGIDIGAEPAGSGIGEHGLVSRAALLRAGCTDAAIRRALHVERLHRVRPGWFAAPDADRAVVTAVRQGCGLTCVNALKRHDVWVPEEAAHGTHLRVPEHVRRRRPRPKPGFRYCATGPCTEPLVDGIEDATRAAAHCVTGADLVTVLDSLLNRELLSPAEMSALFPNPPRRLRRILDAVDGSAESGSETRVRLHVRARHLPYRSQVFIPGVGTVDLLVGRSLIVESDGDEHHGGEHIDDDHDRDLRAAALGFVTLRASYRHIFHRFADVAAALDMYVSLGLHRLPTKIAV